MGHRIGQPLGGEWRQVGWLGHHAVARCKNACQWRKNHEQRAIPCACNADHAFGLVTQLCACAKKVERKQACTTFRFHPFVDMFDGVFQGFDGRLNVQHHGADGMSTAKVSTDDIANLMRVLLQQLDASSETIFSNRCFDRPFRNEGHALAC